MKTESRCSLVCECLGSRFVLVLVLAILLVKLSLVSGLDVFVCGGLRIFVNLVIGGCIGCEVWPF